MSIETIRTVDNLPALELIIQSIRGFEPRGPARAAGGGVSFADTLGQALGTVDRLQLDADGEAAKVAQGGGNLHEMSLALEKADVAMRLAVKVRNKLLDAYNEIMKMGV